MSNLILPEVGALKTNYLSHITEMTRLQGTGGGGVEPANPLNNIVERSTNYHSNQPTLIVASRDSRARVL